MIISVSVFVLAFSDAISKQLSSSLSIWQIFFVRSLFALPIMAVIFRVTGTAFRVQATKWVVLRSVFLVMTWICYYSSFTMLTLSVAATAIYMFPVMIALFSSFLTKEPATSRQWTGIVLGFVGVVIILKPGTDAFSWFTLLPLLGAVFLALAMLVTREKCQEESPLMISFSQLVGFFVAGLAGLVWFSIFPTEADLQSTSSFVFSGWRDMLLSHWGLMAFTAILAIGIFSGIGKAYQIAPPAIVAVFDYVYLLSAAIWGFVFFSEIPGFATVLGMATITVAGALVALPAAQSRAD